MHLSIAVLSKPGGRILNEDACGYWTTDNACCCVVSDGLGGYHGGQVAAQLVVSTMLQRFSGYPDISPEFLMDLLVSANQALLQEKSAHADLAEMRATAVILAIDFARGLGNWAHLGDTRLYCFRQGRIEFRTSDHSYLQNMVNLGHLDDSQLREHPMRNLLLGALGSTEEFTPTIQDQPVSVKNGDAFLICTDGFWQVLEDTEMLQALAQANSVEEWLSGMEALLLTRVLQGHDNYSAIAVWLRSPNAISDLAADSGGHPDAPGAKDDEFFMTPAWATRTLPLG